ncbi:putative secreted domain protein [Rhodococcus sp. MTM3W5.2]|uniref:Ig-like domain-containing protein n=1 Tax=Rhodococcus sp. MTM3W5.2 TaxID=1805827 RepID=UPI0009798471|nr:Ig-like domain-containing protein [Rhodococcus sp. MTM3W5.2]AQA24961.1 putative secreted domain protein [Rhodococcus sp. MTM3W5.2]
MKTTISAPGGRKRLTTAFGGAILALFLAAFGALVLPAAAQADPASLQYSADNSVWGDMSQIPDFQGELIPGGELTTTFYAKNPTSQGGTLQVYLGNWTKTAPDMQAYVRVEVNDASGAIVDLTNNLAAPGTELQSTHLGAGQTAKVMLVVGMPADAGNESQNQSVNPDFALDFEQDAAAVATTTTLTGPATANSTTAFELTATVAPAGATGTVQFKDNGASIGQPVPLTNGVAKRTQILTTAGAHSITAVYNGADGFIVSTSEVLTVTVTTTPVEPGAGSAGSSSGSLGDLGSIFGS